MRIALLVATAAAVALVPLGTEARAHSAKQKRPNIVVFETDDQTVEALSVMPKVHRLLAAKGVTFDSSFVSFSLCCPSRATFLTGQYAHNHGVLGNEEPLGGYYKLNGSNTLPVWLQRAGYATILLGKYLNRYGTRNPTEIPPGWTEFYGSVDPFTYRYYGVELNENGVLDSYSSTYTTDLEAQKAVDIVRRRAPSPQPFFLWLTFLAPHAGGPNGPGHPAGTAFPAAKYFHHFDSAPLPTPPSFNEQDVSDKPLAVRRLPFLTAANTAAIATIYRRELETLLSVDDAVAQIVAALQQSGELDNTVIFFTSDNGFMHGEHRISQGKVVVYEPSIRVPLIVRGPGIPVGIHLAQPVSNIDLAPTIAALAGAKPGLTVDGKSLVPLFRDPGIWWGRDLLFEAAGSAAFDAIRTPRYVYAQYPNGDQELYDLKRDPYELTSRHADPAYAQVRSELAGRLAKLQTCAGAACRTGPALALSVSCVGRKATASLRGADIGLVTHVDFLTAGRLAARVRAAPFRRALATPPRAKVRARAVLNDGRIVTRDRAAPRCRSGRI